MEALFNKACLEHDTGLHPESAQRMMTFGPYKEIEPPFTLEHILQVHPERVVKRVEKFAKEGIPFDSDTVTSKGTYKAAVYAANLAVEAAKTENFAFIRPPGHHAFRDHPAGFCFFNNIAIAAQYLVNQGKKVLIIDFDGHFGDGTSSIFYDSNKVLFCSFHQYPAYPGTGNFDQIGHGEGEGYNINVTLPPGSGDDIIKDALRSFMPVFKQFKPDIIGFSAGFDAHETDHLLQLRFSTFVYYYIADIFRKEFQSFFAVLEGGYEPEILNHCITNFLDGINQRPCTYDQRSSDSSIKVWDEYIINHDQLISKLNNYWNFK